MVFRTFAINNTKIVTWTASIINDSAITLRRTMLSCFPRCSLTCTKRASVCCSVDLFDLFTLYFSSPFFFFFSANLPPLAVSFRCTRTEQTRGQDTSVSFHCPLPPPLPPSPDPGHKRINYAIEPGPTILFTRRVGRYGEQR